MPDKITIEPILTPYNDQEDYILINGISLPTLFEEYAKERQDEMLLKFVPLNGLCPTWGRKLLQEGEIRFIQTMMDREAPTVLPLLVCEDDLDLSCLVMVALVRKEDRFVYWDKIGYILHVNEEQNEMECGILHLESYTDQDWNIYGDNIAVEKVGSEAWKAWINENWEEELYRRRMNFTLPYYEKEGNVMWLKDTNWKFERGDYEGCIDWYRMNGRKAKKLFF